MTKPLVVFTGAALATMAALLGVTADKWKVHAVSATGTQLASGSADAAPSGPTTVKVEKQDATSAGTTGAGETSAAAPSTQTAAVSTELPAIVESTPPSAPDLMPDDSKPSFDTIRVEPDGTAVMAGRGLPDSDVTILFNDQPIGSAKTDPAGAWVLVPMEPLPVGDYQVTLRMQQQDAEPVSSDQSIALKVPERGTDKALVVLSEQNQPSRVLQLPAAVAAAEQAVAPPAAEEPAVAPPAAEPAVAAATAEPAVAPPAAEPAAASASEITVADAKRDATSAADTAPSASQRSVELPLNLGSVDYNDQGDIIFSGTATGGATVRLYVDNSHVGDALAESGGQWQFAGREQIRPGTHSLRVDKLHANGSVAERVELPFVRAEPTAVAALVEQPPAAMPSAEPAPAVADGTAQEPAANSSTSDSPAQKAAEQLTAGAASEISTVSTVPAPPPAIEESAPNAAAEPAVGALSEVSVAVTAGEQPAAIQESAPIAAAEPAAGSASDDLAANTAAKEPMATTADQTPVSSDAPVSTTTDAIPLAQPASTDNAAPSEQTPAADQVAVATGSSAEVASSSSGGASDAVAASGGDQPAAGQPRNGRVVIQPGNNLWRISRVIYGQGVQYTVIYQANREQIRNPDLIYPGQIFATPGVVAPEMIDPERKEPLPGVAGGATSG